MIGTQIKTWYLRADFRQTPTISNSKRNKTLHTFTSIKISAASFVGKGGFLTRYSKGHKK